MDLKQPLSLRFYRTGQGLLSCFDLKRIRLQYLNFFKGNMSDK